MATVETVSVGYATFKLIVATGVTAYYTADNDGYQLYAATDVAIFVGSTAGNASDTSDFVANIQPTAVLVANLGEAIAKAALALPSLSFTSGLALESTLTGVKAGTDKIPASPAQEHATAGSPHAVRLTDGTTFYKATTPADTQPVSAASLPLPTGAAQEHTTAGSPSSVRLTDGTAFYKPTTPSDTQPISAASLPLPTGAATAAKQPALGTAGTPSSDVLTIQGVASMTAVKVDGSGVTQPISAASLPLPTGAATSANQTNGTQQSQLTDGTTGPVAVKAASTAAAAADKSLVVGLSPNSPLPTGSNTVGKVDQGAGGASAWKVDGSAVTQPVSAASLPLPTGASTAAKQPALGTAGTPSADVISVQGASGMTALKTDGSGVTQPISASSLPLPTGAATSANQTNGTQQSQLTDGTTGPVAVKAASTAAVAADKSLVVGLSPNSPLPTGSNTVGKVDQGAGGASAWKVDGSAVTQPVSASSLPLPTGAATSANQTNGSQQAQITDGTTGPVAVKAASTAAAAADKSLVVGLSPNSPLPSGSNTVGKLDQGVGGSSAWKVDGSAVTQPVSAASLPLPSNAAQETGGNLALIKSDADSILANQTNGTQKSIARGGTKGATTAADLTGTAEGVDHQALDVQIYHGGTAKDPTQIRALTTSDAVNVGQWIGSAAPTVGQKTSAASIPVTIASDQSVERSTSGSPAGVTVSTSAIQLVASNNARRAILIVNNGNTNVFLGRDGTVTASGSTMGIKLVPGGSYSDSGVDLDTGAIFAIGSAVASSQNVSVWEKT